MKLIIAGCILLRVLSAQHNIGREFDVSIQPPKTGALDAIFDPATGNLKIAYVPPQHGAYSNVELILTRGEDEDVNGPHEHGALKMGWKVVEELNRVKFEGRIFGPVILFDGELHIYDRSTAKPIDTRGRAILMTLKLRLEVKELSNPFSGGHVHGGASAPNYVFKTLRL